WVEGCDQLKIPITAKDALPFVDAYRVRKHQKSGTTPNSDPAGKKRTAFLQEAFVDALVEFIVGDDQSLNVVENEQLRAIFLMLRSELKDSDIPHRTKIRKRIIEMWDDHLTTLEAEMAVCTPLLLGNISLTSNSSQLGWVTLDNAPNNDTMMMFLESELNKHGIPFRKLERRIW
ncbi:hypothetical protein B0H19DRAFT_1346609, partial [Mycena capillaripes]